MNEKKLPLVLEGGRLHNPLWIWAWKTSMEFCYVHEDFTFILHLHISMELKGPSQMDRILWWEWVLIFHVQSLQ